MVPEQGLEELKGTPAQPLSICYLLIVNTTCWAYARSQGQSRQWGTEVSAAWLLPAWCLIFSSWATCCAVTPGPVFSVTVGFVIQACSTRV